MEEILTSIDLGTSKVCVVIAQIDKNGQAQIVGLGKSPCNGIKKGVVVDIEATSKSIVEAVEQAENMANVQIQGAYINIPGGYSNITNNSGVVAVSSDNREISYEDIDRVLNSATIISIPQGQRIIDVIPNQYIIDGYDEINDPLGMVGIRLEVDADIISTSITTTQNLIKSVNKAGLEVFGIIIEPLATSESVLTKDEKELGVLLIDIGAGTSDISIFKNGRLIFSNLIPVGGNHITNDISIGLKIPFKESEEIKKRNGLAYSDLSIEDKSITVIPIGKEQEVSISERHLTEIIESRVGEILQLIDNELTKSKIKYDLLAGVVITGGGASYLRGIKELANHIFNLPIRIGQPSNIGTREPIYSLAVGMVNYTHKRRFKYYIENNSIENKRSRFKGSIKEPKKVVSLLKKIWDDYF